MNLRFASAILVLLALCIPAGPSIAGTAPDPEQIAQHCIHRADAMAQHRTQHNQALAAQCVAAIEDLLANGHVHAAHVAAQNCIGRIVIRSNHTVQRIREDCQTCIEVLVSMDAPALAHAVGQACRMDVHAVNASRHAAVSAIRDALEGGEPESVSACPGDLDGNGVIGAADLANLIAAWGTAPGESETGATPDVDGDGVVGAPDMVDLMLIWGACP